MVDNLEAPPSASGASVHARREASSNHRVCERASASHHVECEKAAWHKGFSTSSLGVSASPSHARRARATAETSSPDDFRGFEPGEKNFCKFGRETESHRGFDAPRAESATVIRTPASPCAPACSARSATLARSRPRQQTIPMPRWRGNHRAKAAPAPQISSLRLSRSLTVCGLALPPDALITCPTNQPIKVGLALA